MGLLDQLLPKLNTATASGQPASVMSILDSTRSYPAGLNLKDLGLTNSYSLKSAADHCTGMTDVYLDHLSKTHPSLTLMHAYPGVSGLSFTHNASMVVNMCNNIQLVGSDLFRGIPFGSLVKFAFKPITTNTEVCAEYLLEPLTSTTRKAGVFSVGAKGQELARPSIPTEVSKAVVEHTDRVLGH